MLVAKLSRYAGMVQGKVQCIIWFCSRVVCSLMNNLCMITIVITIPPPRALSKHAAAACLRTSEVDGCHSICISASNLKLSLLSPYQTTGNFFFEIEYSDAQAEWCWRREAWSCVMIAIATGNTKLRSLAWATYTTCKLYVAVSCGLCR